MNPSNLEGWFLVGLVLRGVISKRKATASSRQKDLYTDGSSMYHGEHAKDDGGYSV